MSLLLTTGEAERLGHALSVVSRDELVAGTWYAELTTAVGALLGTAAALILETPQGAQVVGAAAGAALAVRWANYARRTTAPAAGGVWSCVTREPAALGRPCDVVGMTARGPGGAAAQVSLVCLTPPPLRAEAAARRAALLRLLFPVFEAAVRRRGEAPRAGGGVVGAVGGYVADAAAALGRRHRLTPRELDVTRLLLHGRSNSEIADALGISGHTARHHTESVFSKLAVRSRATLWSVALEAAGAGA